MLAPALRSRSPLGHFGDFRRDPLGLLTRAAQIGTDLVRVRLGPWWWTLTVTPGAVQHVLQTKASNYRKGFFARSFGPVVGDSLLLSEGDTWLRHRRVAQSILPPTPRASPRSAGGSESQRPGNRWTSRGR